MAQPDVVQGALVAQPYVVNKEAGVAIKEADVPEDDVAQAGVELVSSKLIPIPLRKMRKSLYIGNG